MAMGLHTLVRLRRARLDAKRRALALLRSEQDALVAGINRLEQGLRDEQDIAARSPEGMYAYGRFAATSVVRRRDLEKALAAKQLQVAAVHGEVMAAFREIKKLDVVIERHEAERRLTEERREQASLDQMALDMHRRRESATEA